MGLLSLITGNKPVRVGFRDESDSFDILLVDVTNADSYDYTNEVSSSPIEEGPDVNDHIRPKAITYNIEGEISETPITLAASVQGLITAAGAKIGSALGGFGASAGAAGASLVGASLFGGSNPAIVGRRKLEDLIQRRAIFTIVTKNRILTNMTLTSLKFPRSKGDGKTLKFSATAVQLNIVKSQTVLIKNISKSASGSAAKKSKLGNQATTAATEQTEKQSSILFKGLKALGG